MRANHVAVASVLAAAAAACEPSAPASPSWQVDVMPIMAANCVRCHGFPRIGNGPDDLRLDSFESIQIGFLPDDGDEMTPLEPRVVLGALGYGVAAADRAEKQTMPPRFPIEPWQIDTLRIWAPPDTVPERGEPRPGNQLPSLVVRELGRDATTLTLAYSLHDPDGDLVAGTLCDDDGATCAFVAPIQTGEGELTVDLTGLTLPIDLVARIDDGAGFIDVPALTVEAP